MLQGAEEAGSRGAEVTRAAVPARTSVEERS